MDTILDNLLDISKQAFSEIVAEVAEDEVVEKNSMETSENDLILAFIGLTGEISGRILFYTSYETGKKLAEKMNFGEELESEEEMYSFLAEFMNMFCGRAVTYMNNKYGKREIWISPPSVTSTRSINIVTPNLLSEKAHYACSVGDLAIDVGYVTSSVKTAEAV